MIRIPLYGRANTVKGYALADADDLPLLSTYRFSLHPRGYAVHYFRQNGRRHALYLARLLLDPPPGHEVDHINGDPLDNRRSNLRLCTHAENMQNRKVHRHSSSGQRAVLWDSTRSQWRVRPTLGGKRRHLGWFTDVKAATEAAQAWRANNMPFAVEGR